MIPKALREWAVDEVLEHYEPFLICMSLWSIEIEEARELIKEAIERESDRRLELIRKFYHGHEDLLGELDDIESHYVV